MREPAAVAQQRDPRGATWRSRSSATREADVMQLGPDTRNLQPARPLTYLGDTKGASAMTTKDTSSDQDIPKNTEPEPEPGAVHKRNKRRKHGYRGYPNNSTPGSSVHMGTGFGGVGSTRGAGSSGSGIFTDKTREAVQENDEEE